MRTAFLKYYFDLTRYNAGISILVGLVSQSPLIGLIAFGTVGMVAALVCYKSFQNNQYYFYHNLGFSKARLISVVWGVNLFMTTLILAMVL